MDASQPPPQLPSLSELKCRMQAMRVSDLSGETISEHAEWFYQRRHLLLSICQDIYNSYTTLLNRFNPQNPKPIDTDTYITFEIKQDIKKLVSLLVTANLDKDIARHEFQEASKTIELLKKLVKLLDMEKELALEETASLGYKLVSILEENRELAIEALFMKNEAVKLARCMLKMKDDHFHKIGLLQNRIYELQSSRESVCETPSCFGLDHKNKIKKRKMSETRSENGEKRRSKWFKRFKTINPFT